MDRLECLELFVRVADAGSFTIVGRERGMGQSSVSRKIGMLEEMLGTQLLLRTTRHVSLTNAGMELYERAGEIIAQYQSIEHSIGREAQNLRGRLRIDAPNEFGRLHVLPHIMSFMEIYRDVTIDLSLNDQYIDLVQSGVDLSIRIGNLDDSSIISRKIGRDKRWIVASPKYIEKYGTPNDISDLPSHRCIIYSYRKLPTRWEFVSSKGKHSVTISGQFRSNTGAAMREAALRGHGITILGNYAIAKDIEAGDLQVILPQYQVEPLDVQFVYLTKRHMPLVCREFMEYFIEKIKSSGVL